MIEEIQPPVLEIKSKDGKVLMRQDIYAYVLLRFLKGDCGFIPSGIEYELYLDGKKILRPPEMDDDS